MSRSRRELGEEIAALREQLELVTRHRDALERTLAAIVAGVLGPEEADRAIAELRAAVGCGS